MARKPRPAARGQVRVPAHHYDVAARYREGERAEIIEVLGAVAAFWALAFIVEIVAHALGF